MNHDTDTSTEDEQYHVAVQPEDVAETVLLPGDPERVDAITQYWDKATERAHHREYRTVTGSHNGTEISVTSTGIGSPSAAIAVEELASVGVENFIRVGSTGAIQPDMGIGDLVITTGAVRQEGTSDEYVRTDYPAVADHEVVAALIAAAERLDYDYHVGLTMSADSFYSGQGRPGFGGFQALGSESLLDELQALNVKNIEMEASAILTLGNVFDVRAGAICTVYANRVTGEFRTVGDERAAQTASLAVSLLEQMDQVKTEAGIDHWHAGLSL